MKYLLPLFLLATSAQAQETIKVPFELIKTQHIAVQVKINGKGPYRLIFDTGAPITLLNNKVAKEANVFPKDFKKPIFAFFGSMGQFKINDFEIGGAKAEGVSAVIMDHPTVAAIAGYVGPIEGIVGFSFFGRYRTTIDYKAKEITLTPVKFAPPDLMEHLVQTITAMSRNPRKIVSPAGVLGLRVEKTDKEPGVAIAEVVPDSAAATAGLKTGDRILTFDARWTDSVIELFDAVSRAEAGEDVAVRVKRGDKEMTVHIKVRAGF